jgi:hypothetical protein
MNGGSADDRNGERREGEPKESLFSCPKGFSVCSIGRWDVERGS